mmetsp:Transcript_24801/g.49539  ORF Transcript_24801/g.49539 Transcript_24801/m.49539 type:complete len:302 (+) Transcript_24801:614-1519(+)
MGYRDRCRSARQHRHVQRARPSGSVREQPRQQVPQRVRDNHQRLRGRRAARGCGVPAAARGDASDHGRHRSQGGGVVGLHDPARFPDVVHHRLRHRRHRPGAPCQRPAHRRAGQRRQRRCGQRPAAAARRASTPVPPRCGTVPSQHGTAPVPRQHGTGAGRISDELCGPAGHGRSVRVRWGGSRGGALRDVGRDGGQDRRGAGGASAPDLERRADRRLHAQLLRRHLHWGGVQLVRALRRLERHRRHYLPRDRPGAVGLCHPHGPESGRPEEAVRAGRQLLVGDQRHHRGAGGALTGPEQL